MLRFQVATKNSLPRIKKAVVASRHKEAQWQPKLPELRRENMPQITCCSLQEMPQEQQTLAQKCEV